MSEAPANPQAAGPSAGQLLREAREAAGLHVATLAANLKVPVRKLEALELDQYDQLGDAVFVRALASSVCRTLKMDPQPVLARLPQTGRPRLVADVDGINAPFRASGQAPSAGWMNQVSRPVALVVVALLLAAVVLIFLPVAQREGEASKATAKTEPAMPPGTPTEIVPPAENGAASAPVTAGTPPARASAAAPAAAAPSSLPQPAAPVVAAAPAPAASAAAPAASSPLAAASAPAAAASGVVTFHTRGDSWIQVTDARGTPVFRKLMQAGETAGATGALPLSVTVGSVGQTEVQVRGKPFDMQPVARDNVARFQVN